MAFTLDVGFVFRGPFFVDLDKDGQDEPFEGLLAWEGPDLDGSALELLLDGALDRV